MQFVSKILMVYKSLSCLNVALFNVYKKYVKLNNYNSFKQKAVDFNELCDLPQPHDWVW